MKNWLGTAFAFLLGQGGLQAIQVVTGFLLIRWLEVEDYASYTMVFSFQAIAIAITDMGVSGTIVSLVGKNHADKTLLSKYLKAAYDLRLHFFILSSIGICIVFPLLTYKFHWKWYITFLYLISILLVVYFNGFRSIYKAPLSIHHKIKRIYASEQIGALLKLSLISIVQALRILGSEIAVCIHAFTITVSSLFMRGFSKTFRIPVKEKQPALEDEFKRMIYPVMPGIVFSSFQGQVTILLISWFGNVQHTAEIGALGRLSQLFSFFNVGVTLFIVPYFARLSTHELKKKYIVVLGGGLCFAFILVTFTYLFPQPLLFLMGTKYIQLKEELVWVVLNAGLLFLANLMWVIQGARKWIFNWMPYVSIPGTIALQIILVCIMNLSLTHEVLLFTIYTTLFSIGFRMYCAYAGFTQKEKS